MAEAAKSPIVPAGDAGPEVPARRFRDYTIVVSPARGLPAAIKKLMEEGWVPCGGPVILGMAQTSAITQGAEPVLGQAMALPVEVS